MNFYDYWILKTNISSNIKIKLLTQFKTTENIYKELIEKGNLSFVNINEHDKLTLTYRTLKDNFNIEEYNAILLKHKIKFVKYTDEKYPEKLKNIDSPPYGLFYKGNIEFTNDYCLSIIGTRNCTPYGEEVCKNIAKEISVNQVGIISGGARGKHVIIVIKVNMICINKEFKGFQENKLSMYYLERIINCVIFVNSTSVLKIKQKCKK